MNRIITYLIMLLLACTGCHKKSTSTGVSHLTGSFLKTTFTISIVKPLNQKEMDKIGDIIKGIANDMDHIVAEVETLNQLKAHQPITISSELESLLFLMQTAVKLTNGCYDSVSTGWNHIHLRNSTFHKDKDETTIDLKYILKAYAVDLLLERLNRAGYHDTLVAAGEDKRAIGHRPDNSQWEVNVNALNQQINLVNQAITTRAPWTVRAQTCTLAEVITSCLLSFDSIEEANQWLTQFKQKTPDLPISTWSAPSTQK